MADSTSTPNVRDARWSPYLASEQCELTHEIFDVGGGRYARVFIGMAKGWVAPKGTIPDAEHIYENIDVIREQDGYTVPRQHRRRDQGRHRGAAEPAVAPASRTQLRG